MAFSHQRQLMLVLGQRSGFAMNVLHALGVHGAANHPEDFLGAGDSDVATSVVVHETCGLSASCAGVRVGRETTRTHTIAVLTRAIEDDH